MPDGSDSGSIQKLPHVPAIFLLGKLKDVSAKESLSSFLVSASASRFFASASTASHSFVPAIWAAWVIATALVFDITLLLSVLVPQLASNTEYVCILEINVNAVTWLNCKLDYCYFRFPSRSRNQTKLLKSLAIVLAFPRSKRNRRKALILNRLQFRRAASELPS